MASATTKVKAFVDLVERRKGLKVIVCVTPRVYKFFWWALDFILYIIACRRNMCILNQVEKKRKPEVVPIYQVSQPVLERYLAKKPQTIAKGEKTRESLFAYILDIPSI